MMTVPLKECNNEGKSGWKWGDSGHCYTGPGAKKKAIKQGVAIEGPDKFAEKASEEEFKEALLTVGTLGDKVRLVLSRKANSINPLDHEQSK
jgi:hypothetical protein